MTIDSLIAHYAKPIADSAGLDPSDYDKTAAGLASLLSDTSACLSPADQTRDWLEDAAADLDAIARLAHDNPAIQKLLARVDSTLYEAKSDLELD